MDEYSGRDFLVSSRFIFVFIVFYILNYHNFWKINFFLLSLLKLLIPHHCFGL